MAIVFVGIDLAKKVSAVLGVDEYGKAALVRCGRHRAGLFISDGYAGRC